MFYGYTEIDIRVYSRLMIRVYVAVVRKFVKQDLTRIFLKKISQIESLTD